DLFSDLLLEIREDADRVPPFRHASLAFHVSTQIVDFLNDIMPSDTNAQTKIGVLSESKHANQCLSGCELLPPEYDYKGLPLKLAASSHTGSCFRKCGTKVSSTA
ncbi:MAG: hypothetical protein ACJA1E_001263, partial [Paracoccaceae bacterium]